MNATDASGVAQRGAPGVSIDAGEIQSLQHQKVSQRPIARTELLPEEEKVSLPSPFSGMPGTIEPLTRFLGPALTVSSLAWTAGAVLQMRTLQKKFVEHSLTLDESDRSECLAAITVVETAIQFRLRLQQMHMTELEMDTKTENGKRNEKENKA